MSRKQVDADKYYPRFERVTDNFGFTATNAELATRTNQGVKAGDTLAYRISAWNPRPEEPLEFRLQLPGRFTDWTTTDVLSVTLTPDDIRRSLWVGVRLRSQQTKARRPYDDDSSVMFIYLGIPD